MYSFNLLLGTCLARTSPTSFFCSSHTLHLFVMPNCFPSQQRNPTPFLKLLLPCKPEILVGKNPSHHTALTFHGDGQLRPFHFWSSNGFFVTISRCPHQYCMQVMPDPVCQDYSGFLCCLQSTCKSSPLGTSCRFNGCLFHPSHQWKCQKFFPRRDPWCTFPFFLWTLLL